MTSFLRALLGFEASPASPVRMLSLDTFKIAFLGKRRLLCNYNWLKRERTRYMCVSQDDAGIRGRRMNTQIVNYTRTHIQRHLQQRHFASPKQSDPKRRSLNKRVSRNGTVSSDKLLENCPLSGKFKNLNLYTRREYKVKDFEGGEDARRWVD